MIAVIDYGMGNLRSVTNALEKLGADAVVTRDKKIIKESARRLFCPESGLSASA